MTLKDALNNLPNEDKRRLMYAFEHEMAQHISLPDGKYIGVNAHYIKHLEPVETAGVWSYGYDRSNNQ